MTFPSAFVDLHLHTLHSDGTCTPQEVVSLASRARLTAIAITDHDTVAAIAEAGTVAREAGIELIPGIELSSNEGRSDVHILGYFLNIDAPGLDGELSILRDGRHQRAQRTVELLKGLGATVEFERVLEIAGTAPIGRPHIAEALVETGHAATIDEAFDRFIGYHAPAFVPKRALDPALAVDLIRRAGGVAVLAHPGSLRRDDLIPGLVESGLGGIEVWHPKHDAGRIRHYREIAERFDLAITGGSDFHGGGRGSATVGEQPVPDQVLEPLRVRARGSGC